MTPEELEAKAKTAFEAEAWQPRTEWADLSEDTRQIWRDFVLRRGEK